MAALKRKKLKKLEVLAADLVENNGTPASCFLQSVITQLEDLDIEKKGIKIASYV